MKVFLFVILSTFSIGAFADVCGSIIAGASLQGFQGSGSVSGYDADGSCKVRSITESSCRNLSGSLFIRFSEDHGKGYSLCVFRQPSGSSSSNSSSSSHTCPYGKTACGNGCMPLGAVCCGTSYCDAGNQCRSDGCFDPAKAAARDAQIEQTEKQLESSICEDTANDFSRNMKKLDADSPILTDNVEFLLKESKDTINKYCPDVGRRNVVTWAESNYNRLMAAAKAVKQADVDEEARRDRARQQYTRDHQTPQPDDSTSSTPSTTKSSTCNNVASDTAVCRSDVVPMGKQNNCFGSPSITGLDNFTVKLSIFCREDSYMAAFATYDDDGNCTRQVVQIDRGSHHDSQLISSTSYAKKPHILDSIVSTSDLQACYMQRHNGCSCD